MTQVKVSMTADEQKVSRAIAKLSRDSKELKEELRRVKAGARSAGGGFDKMGGKVSKAMSPQRVTAFVGSLVGVTGVLGAVNRINAGYEVWLQNTKEIAEATAKASNEIIAFAALQAGGTKAQRVETVTGLAAGFGIQDRGQAFNAVQALQSAIAQARPNLSESQAYESGLRAARTVFRATQVGIPLQSGLEAEVLGAAQGAKPGDFIRYSFAAGQASARDPATLATAAPSLVFFDDKQFGFAVAAQLAGTFGTETATFTKAAGIALSDVSKLSDTFKKLDVGEGATRFERLGALAEAGVRTPEDLAKLGLKEIRQAQAVSNLVQNVPAIVGIQSAIESQAKPGLLLAQRQAVEGEIPIVETQRKRDILRAAVTSEQAFGEHALGRSEADLKQIIRALAFERIGADQVLWFDLVKDGRSTAVDEGLFRLGQHRGFPTVEEFEAEVARLTRAAAEGADALERAISDFRGGAALGNVNDDR